MIWSFVFRHYWYIENKKATLSFHALFEVGFWKEFSKIKVEFLKELTKQTQIFTIINPPHPPTILMHLLASCRLKNILFYLHYISNTLNASVIYFTDLRYHAYKLWYQLHDIYFCFYRVFFRLNENPRENLNRIMRISNSRGFLKPPTSNFSVRFAFSYLNFVQHLSFYAKK